jgi:glycosyltransferase involved in cell wall biosynthesis
MKVSPENIKRASEIFRAEGWRGIKRRGEIFRRKYSERRAYKKWIKNHELKNADRESLRRQISEFSHKPLISVVLPVYNVEEKWLRLCVESVFKQIYAHWELCIADDCSTKSHIRSVLEEYAAKDARIKIVFRAENGHISAASNSALELASGEFAALLDHDDELAEDALFYVVKEINDFPDAAFVYTDEDMIDTRGTRYEPKFKPDFSRDFFYSVNYLTHLAVYRTEILREIGGFRLGAEGSQDYDLALRVVERIGENQIRHIPKILYHWRAIEGSVAYSSNEKTYAHERAREAIRRHLERTGKKARVSAALHNMHRVHYDLPEKPPKVSLIITTDEAVETAKQTIVNFVENTDYSYFEIILIGSINLKNALENQSFAAQTKIIVCENQSKAARFNCAAKQTDAEILCFVEANLKPNAADWLNELVGFAAQTEIAAVGGKILSIDEKISGGGLIIGTNETISVAHHSLPRETAGNLYRAQLINNFSAVSAPCLAVRRELFTENGGFDAVNFPEKFFDVDFCLRLHEKKYRIVFTPYAELTRVAAEKTLNSRKKATENENVVFREKWGKTIESDPFYNPNFSKKNGAFTIETAK